jgi:bifunctional DNA-binding transcriptional regulator/antitoxin component of YhaV-PrlF toxin-antitoxin module
MPLADEQISRITSKGQVLLHKSVRERIGIIPGAQVRVGTNDYGQAVIEPVDAIPADPAERQRRFRIAMLKYGGMFHDGRSTDEKMRELRGDPEL